MTASDAHGPGTLLVSSDDHRALELSNGVIRIEARGHDDVWRPIIWVRDPEIARRVVAAENGAR